VRARSVTALSLVLALRAADARADYKDSYKQGVEAAEKGRWAEVQKYMQEAIAGKATEGETIRFYGQRFEPYLPHYYLGLALFNNGDCEGAVRSWNASESQGAVKKAGDAFRQLTKNKATCQTRLAGGAKPSPTATAGPDPGAVNAAVQGAETALGRADEAARAVASLQSDSLLAPTWAQDTGLGPAQDKAKETLSTARARFDAGKRKPDLAQIAEAQELASRAASQFDAVRSHATQKRVTVATPSPTPRPLGVTPVTPSPSAATGPPPELVAAAQAFFGAQYQQAANLLGPLEGLPGRAGAHAMVIRAAARHALYLVGGERDSALLSSAAADVRTSRQRDPSLRPDPRAFSPRFLEFFQKTR